MTKYVRTTAAGANNGTSMANAWTATTSALGTALTAGETLLIASDTDDNYTSAQSWSFTNGSVSAPNIIRSVNSGTEAYEAGALIKTTGNFNLLINTGHIVIEGVNFSLGIGATAATSLQFGGGVNLTFVLRDSTITIPAFLSSRAFFGNNSGGRTLLDNVTINSGNANGNARLTGTLTWKNSTPYTGTIPTNLIETGSAGVYTFDGCDLSAFNSKAFMAGGSGATAWLRLFNCKLPASYTPFASNVTRGHRLTIINCSTVDGKLRREEHDYAGSVTLNSDIYRTGGASDPEGNYSCKIATTANSSRYWPAYSFDIAFYVAAADVGVSKTVTAYLQTDNSITLAANEAWLEVDYLGDSSTLDSAFATSGPANSGANGTAPASDGSSTWTTTGLTTPVKQTVSRTFTPQKAGMHRARVALARASTNTFVDLKTVLS